MDRKILNAIMEILSQVLAAQGYECIEVEWDQGEKILRVFIDGPDGVNIDDCVKVSRLLQDHSSLDEILSGQFQLEVSSPGVERPIRLSHHFKKHIGSKIKVKLVEKILSRKQASGEIISVSEDGVVTIDIGQGEHISFPLENLGQAHLIHEWQ
jgi:ribosome maturation factor RimP